MWTKIEQTGHYRGPNRAKWAQSGVEVVQGWIWTRYRIVKIVNSLQQSTKIQGQVGNSHSQLERLDHPQPPGAPRRNMYIYIEREICCITGAQLFTTKCYTGNGVPATIGLVCVTHFVTLAPRCASECSCLLRRRGCRESEGLSRRRGGREISGDGSGDLLVHRFMSADALWRGRRTLTKVSTLS